MPILQTSYEALSDGVAGSPAVPPDLGRRGLWQLGLGVGVAALIVACGPESHKRREYPLHTKIIATVFYLGEDASEANAGISNVPTAWDGNSVERFGGVDDPSRRSEDSGPIGFRPKHNPYYFALPADEFDKKRPIKGAHETSPWVGEPVGEGRSLFKGRWIEVKRDGASVYAQWVDCGPSDDPNEARDYGYVFGANDVRPKNTFGLKAGLDLSPAAAHALGFGVKEGGAEVSWRFIDTVDVPDGPWKDYPPINNQIYWR
jgi:hypothetical protein